MHPVDMRSDTVTRPTPGMWDAIRNAELGDDVLGDDPTGTRVALLTNGLSCSSSWTLQ